MSKMTCQEIQQFLEQSSGQYYVYRATFWDLTGGRTRVLFELKNASRQRLLKMLSRSGMNLEPQCSHTFRELSELLKKFSETSPDGKISFTETSLGISIMFDMKGLNKDIRGSSYKTHTIDDARDLPEEAKEHSAGSKTVRYDKSTGRTRMRIQLDENRRWFLWICFDSATGALLKYELDYEGSAYETHLEFKDEAAVREKLYQAGDDEKYLEDLFLRFMEEHSGNELEKLVRPYMTALYHYD